MSGKTKAVLSEYSGMPETDPKRYVMTNWQKTGVWLSMVFHADIPEPQMLPKGGLSHCLTNVPSGSMWVNIEEACNSIPLAYDHQDILHKFTDNYESCYKQMDE